MSITLGLALFLSFGWLLPAIAQQSKQVPGRDEYLYARKLFEEKYYDLAAEQLERCLRDFPGLPEADEAQFFLGETYLQLKDPGRAQAAFLRTAYVYPESPRAPEALFKVGLSLETLNRLKEAAQAYERVEGFYSGSNLAPQALGRASHLYAATGDTIRADDIAGSVIEKYPQSPAASVARIERAERFTDRGDVISALQYLTWVAQRSGLDSLSAEASLRIGRLYAIRYDLSSAREAFQQCIDQHPTTPAAPQARLELASMLNVSGGYNQASAIVAPLLGSPSKDIRAAALVTAGDGCYLKTDFEAALSWYDSAAAYSPEAVVKGAWTCELLGRKKNANDRYLKAINSPPPWNTQAQLRAAILAADLDQPAKAAGFWEKLIASGALPDSTGRLLFELTKARLDAKNSAAISAADTLLAEFPRSPYADDVLMAAAQSSFINGDYQAAVNRLESLLTRYPASPYCDSAKASISYIHSFYLRGEKLIDRMAELSSLPQNRTNPVRWALDWGDFYLNEFKDPVKAADQYDRVLDDILATTDDRIYALFRSGIAYQLLTESARRARDSFSWAMYADSARSRLNQLQRLSPRGSYTLQLGSQLVEFDARLARSNATSPAVVIRRCEDLIQRFGEDSIPPSTIYAYLQTEALLSPLDQRLAINLILLGHRTRARCSDVSLAGAIAEWEVKALRQLGVDSTAVDSARSAISQYPSTPAAANLTLSLVADLPIPMLEKYDLLVRYRRLYPYCVDVAKLGFLQADLLDKLERPLESMAARKVADDAVGWGRPALDILRIPPSSIRLERAVAFRRSGEYPRAAEELNIILHVATDSETVSRATLELAYVEKGRQNPQGALMLLDSLSRNFPDSKSAQQASHLRPELLMSMGDYKASIRALEQLAAPGTKPDSLYDVGIRRIVCLYRLDRLDEAKKEAGDLFKKFKERPDLDQAKALFFLEKGRSLVRGKSWKDAREQYTTVVEKYPFSRSADEAAFASAVSFVEEEKFDEAAKALDKFIADRPESPLNLDALLALGLAQFQIEKYSESVSSLKRVWDSRDGKRLWQTAFEALASVYRNLRFWDALIRLNRDYLERYPEAPDALDRRMDVGLAYIELKEWDEAIRQYRPLLPLADAEREAEIQYYIGEAYQGKGDHRTAILEFLKVKILGRKTKLDWGVTAIYQAGACYEKLGDNDGASRMYRKIIEETGADSNYGRAAQQRLDSLPPPLPPDTLRKP